MKLFHVLIFVAGLLSAEIVAVFSDIPQDDIKNQEKRNTERYPKDCKEVNDQCYGPRASDVYLIQPDGSPEPFEVYCNNSIDGGGWTVIQRRVDGSVDFYRNWTDYKNGFGSLRGNFWLGNEKIFHLTNQKTYELRIDLNNVNGQPFFSKYNLFRINDEGDKYKLVGLGDYDPDSTANYDAVDTSRNQFFSTRDQDNDGTDSWQCARIHPGGWWYYMCSQVWINGEYDAVRKGHSITWFNLPGGAHYLKYAEMKIRPLLQC